MTREVEVDGFKLDFTDAKSAFKFDDSHNLPMKGVDIVVEFPEAFVFVEIKDEFEPELYNVKFEGNESEEEIKSRRSHYRWLKGYLKYKYRDTYLYRHAEGNVGKKIHYICLINFETPLANHLAKELRRDLPLGLAGSKWKNEIVNSCQVVNEDRWKTSFPKWSIERV